MVADYLSKPLQGSLFRTHRNSIMGINEDDKSEFYNLYRNRMDGWGDIHMPINLTIIYICNF